MDPRVRSAAKVGGFVLGLAVATQVSSAGERDHEDGFFLRLSAGMGAAATQVDATVGDIELSGTASDINLAIGGIVTPNLAVHGTIYGWAVNEPDAEIGSLSGDVQGDLSLGAIGAGLTYYVMPLNLYFSGSLGFGSMTLDDNALAEGETDTGLVVDLTIGKEWWVGRKWGLGVAGGLGYHSLPEEGIDENWTGTSVAIRFSATMN